MNKALDFVKRHKKEFVIAAAVTVAGVVIYVITKRKPDLSCAGKKLVDFGKCRNITIPESGQGIITELWTESGYTNAIVENVTISDLGKVGELFKNLDGVTDDNSVSAIFGFVQNTVES